jgi:hypothetical protein
LSGWWWVLVGTAALVFLAIIASVPSPARPRRERRDRFVTPGYDRSAADFPLDRDDEKDELRQPAPSLAGAVPPGSAERRTRRREAPRRPA